MSSAPGQDSAPELGLSQQELADRTGLHHTFIGHVEHGRRNPSLGNLCKLARGLDIDRGELTAGLATTSGQPDHPIGRDSPT